MKLSRVLKRRFVCRFALPALLLNLLAALSACSFVERNTGSLFSSPEGEKGAALATPITSQTTATVPIEGAPAEKPRYSNVEVVWAVPPEPVDGFVIHYGLSADNLESQIRVSSGSLNKDQDKQHGEVYRYIVRDVAADKPVFVAIAAYVGDRTSPLSSVQEVSQ